MATSLRRAKTRQEKTIPMTHARKRELKRRAETLAADGLVLGDIRMDAAPSRFFLCFVRAILIFMAVLGLLGSLVSAFGLPFSLPIVAGWLFLLSFCSAFLYYNRFTFYSGYLLVFVGFITFSVRAYWYVNSGYQAFMNEVYNAYSDYFGLMSIREATEFIENRYLTVTAAMLFIGWFFCILLNITISGYMNLPATFLITFLPLQIAFYIDVIPPMPYLLLLLAVYITVAVLSRSGHFTLPYRHAKSEHFDRRYGRRTRSHSYLASSSGMLRVTGGAILLSTLFLLTTQLLFSDTFSSKYVSNPVKNRTDEYVKNFVQGGVASLFNRYDATGGLAHGRLGGIGNVSPDFETDLTVRFVPTSSDNIYLKAFTGVLYRDNTFMPYYSVTSDADASGGATTTQLTSYDIIENDRYAPQLPDLDVISGAQEDIGRDSNYYARMWIQNVGADEAYEYTPYYSFATSNDSEPTISGLPGYYTSHARAHYAEAFSMFLSGEDGASTSTAESYEALYLPYSSAVSYNPNPTITEEYESYVYDTYLQVPDALEETLDDFWSKDALKEALERAASYDATASQPGLSEIERYTIQQRSRLSIVAALRQYFLENFSYTMSPGATPRGEDVVAYFLTVQKRGYCAHYAASSTLLLRRAGIPTRYIEGYMMTFSEIVDGLPIDTDTTGWLAGELSPGGSGIVEVDVTDASAHAWIEIYLDGYGWIPYDLTPPSGDEERIATNADLLSLFSGFFRAAQRSVEGAQAEGDAGTQQASVSFLRLRLSGLSYLARPLAILLAATLLLLLAVPLLGRLRRRLRLHALLRREDYAAALLLHYQDLLRLLRRDGRLQEAHPTVRDVCTLLQETAKTTEGGASVPSPRKRSKSKQEPLSSSDVTRLEALIDAAAYGANACSYEEYQEGVALILRA